MIMANIAQIHGKRKSYERELITLSRKMDNSVANSQARVKYLQALHGLLETIILEEDILQQQIAKLQKEVQKK